MALAALMALVALVGVALLMRFVPWQRRLRGLTWFTVGCAIVSWATYGVQAARGQGFAWLDPVMFTAVATYTFLSWQRERV
jgi:hypothetical protein